MLHTYVVNAAAKPACALLFPHDLPEMIHCEDMLKVPTAAQVCTGMSAAVLRWEKVATLEFDRHRKSMSVIACAAQPSSSVASGVTTRSASRQSTQNNNVLFVKGAAEYMLSRCSKVGPVVLLGSSCFILPWTDVACC